MRCSARLAIVLPDQDGSQHRDCPLVEHSVVKDDLDGVLGEVADPLRTRCRADDDVDPPAPRLTADTVVIQIRDGKILSDQGRAV